mmetsp:Transcript_7915/g.28107  ORF Transcript_7915/g.28107 Transcript_7915/m.28107 type:complete len:206 (-) Transcript_7915:610-1227(-)
MGRLSTISTGSEGTSTSSTPSAAPSSPGVAVGTTATRSLSMRAASRCRERSKRSPCSFASTRSNATVTWRPASFTCRACASMGTLWCTGMTCESPSPTSSTMAVSSGAARGTSYPTLASTACVPIQKPAQPKPPPGKDRSPTSPGLPRIMRMNMSRLSLLLIGGSVSSTLWLARSSATLSLSNRCANSFFSAGHPSGFTCASSVG